MQNRLHFHPQESIIEIDLSHLLLEEMEQIHQLQKAVEFLLSPRGEMVYGVVNYEGFRVLDELKKNYGLLLRNLKKNYLLEVVSYSCNALVDNGGDSWVKSFKDRREAFKEVRRIQEEKKRNEGGRWNA